MARPRILLVRENTNQASISHQAWIYANLMQSFAEVSVIYEDEIWNADFKVYDAVIIMPYFYLIYRQIEKNMDTSILAKIRNAESIAYVTADAPELTTVAKRLLSDARYIMYPSKFSEEHFVGIKPKHRHLLVYNVPTTLYPEPYVPNNIRKYLVKRLGIDLNKKKYIIYYECMNLPLRKGLPQFVEFADRITKERDDVEVIARGWAGMLRTIEYYKGLRYFRLFGYLPRPELFDIYRSVDVVVVPTRYEGFGLNFVEPLTLGTVTVGTRLPVFEEHLSPEGRNKLLVDWKYRDIVFANNKFYKGKGYVIDVDKLVDRVHDILNNLDEYRAVARKEAELLREKYSPRNVAEMMFKGLERLGVI